MDIENWNIGFLIDVIKERIRSLQRKSGKNVIDYDEKYYQLKALEPKIDEKYKNGEIDEKKYIKFKETLKKWEVE